MLEASAPSVPFEFLGQSDAKAKRLLGFTDHGFVFRSRYASKAARILCPS